MDPITHTSTARRRAHTRRRLAALTLGGVAAAGLLAGACSSDDSEGAATTTSAHEEHGEHASAPLLGEEMDAAACEGFAGVSAAMTGDPSAAGPALEAMEAALPSTLAPYGATMSAAFEAALGGDEAAMGSPEFVTAYEQIGTAMFNGCPAAERLDVDGVDYGFEGLPDTVSSGTVALRFTNRSSSSEMHEIIVLRRADGDDTDLETIATTSPDELMGSMEMVGLAFSDQPEASSTSFMELEPGSYVAICTIPVGGGETGDPHAAHGMIAEFEVA
jgi:hypothetical protein